MGKFRWTPRITVAALVVLTSCKPAADVPQPAPASLNIRLTNLQPSPELTPTAIPAETLDGATFVARMERVNLYYVHRYGFTCFVAVGPQPIALSCTPDQK